MDVIWICVALLGAFLLRDETKNISGFISKTAIWDFNITTNTKNWTVFMQNPNENEMNFNTTKYQMSVEKIGPFLFNLKLKVHFLNWDDMGYYQLQINLLLKNKQKLLVLLHLTVKGKFEKLGTNSKIQFIFNFLSIFHFLF